jgi:hypothetical protein
VRRKGVRRKGVRRKGVRRKGVRRKGVRRKGVRRKGVRRKGVRRKGVRRGSFAAAAALGWGRLYMQDARNRCKKEAASGQCGQLVVGRAAGCGLRLQQLASCPVLCQLPGGLFARPCLGLSRGGAKTPKRSGTCPGPGRRRCARQGQGPRGNKGPERGVMPRQPLFAGMRAKRHTKQKRDTSPRASK